MANPPVLVEGTALVTDPYFYSPQCLPLNGAQNVADSTVLRAVFVAPTGGTPVFTARVDGTVVAAGPPSSPAQPYVLQVFPYAGRYAVEVYVHAPFEEASDHLFEVEAVVGADTYSYRSAFRTARSADVYYGTAANALELAVLTPCTRFLALEPVRRRLLQVALADGAAVSAYRDNLAARALYQVAYDTELSSLLNPYHTPDNSALVQDVREKRSTLAIEAALQPYARSIELGLESLFTLGALPYEYKAGLADARDSLLYTYRVSAAVVAVFLARALEQSST